MRSPYNVYECRFVFFQYKSNKIMHFCTFYFHIHLVMKIEHQNKKKSIYKKIYTGMEDGGESSKIGLTSRP